MTTTFGSDYEDGHRSPPWRHPSPSSSESSSRRSGLSKFKGRVIIFDDGSRWQITDQLSQPKLQQDSPPYEATEVYNCICLEDPQAQYRDHLESVVKIRSQITGPEDSIDWQRGWLRSQEDNLKHFPDSSASVKAVYRARESLHVALNATNEPNSDTLDEIKALERFRAAQCSSAPWLLQVHKDIAHPGTYACEMPEGYIVYILMTKVPGATLDQAKFWKQPLNTREQIRAAFKEALISVWRCGINPTDPALRNIIWHAQEQKCYIVDFESYSLPGEPLDAESFSDLQYYSWGLSKPRFLMSGGLELEG